MSADVVFTDATSQPTNTLAEWAATDAEAAHDVSIPRQLVSDAAGPPPRNPLECAARPPARPPTAIHTRR